MNKSSLKRRLAEGLYPCPLALLVACGADAPVGWGEQTGADQVAVAEPDNVVDEVAANADPVAGEASNSTDVLGVLDLDRGATVTINGGLEGPVSLSIFGDEAAVGATADEIEMAASLLEVYSILAPDAEVPDAVFAAAQRVAEEGALGGGLATELDTDDVRALEAELDGASTDSLAVVPKEASRDVAGFLANYCGADQINESAATKSYARKVQTCQTEKTGNHTQTMTGVVQGVGGARSYRGTIDLVWYWKNGTTWIKGSTDTIAENQVIRRWVYGNPTNDLRFAIENATNDGWHLFVHKADGNFSDQKSLAGTDFYHQLCDCSGPNFGTARTVIEGCQSNQTVFDNNGTGLCGAYALFDPTAIALGITSCGAVHAGTHERVTWGKNCSNAASQDYRDCMLLDECAYECTDVCR